LVEDIFTELNLTEERCIEVKSLEMTPWGTQQAVVVLPVSIVPRDKSIIKLKQD
jgi:hypothetical protein